MNGLDFSYWRPGVDWIKANGYGFVVRYLSWLPNAKVIDKAEFDSYQAAGIQVVLNWEWDTTDMLGGAASGTAHASEARRQAEALGAWPCVIYFSCDRDIFPNEQTLVNDYLRAAGAVLGGPQYVGIYGGYWVVSRAMQAGVAAFGWQTFAWSGGMWYAPAQLRQTGGTNDYDTNFSLADYFGQVGGTMAQWNDNDEQMLQAINQTVQNGLLPLLGAIAQIPSVKTELDAIQAAINAAGGHPADAAITAAIARAQTVLDGVAAKVNKDLA